jgi:ketosteroid isomerase-like protein
MSEESTTPDVVELAGRSFAAAGRHDLDALMSFYAADAVWDMSDVGVGTFEGTAAIRSFFKDWWATWEDHHQEVRGFQDFGNGVLFAATVALRVAIAASNTRGAGSLPGWTTWWCG